MAQPDRKPKDKAGELEATLADAAAQAELTPAGLAIRVNLGEPTFILERVPLPEPGQVRKGLHYALWELDAEHRSKGRALGSQALASQLMLGETVAGDMEGPGLLEIIGSDMTMGQRRAIHALYILLHDRGYRPDEAIDETTPRGYKVTWQSIIFTPIEYLEAYGLERAASGRMPRAQREDALEALNELARQPRQISYQRVYYEQPPSGRGRSKRKADRIVYTGPLLTVTRAYSGLEGEEIDSPEAPDAKRLQAIKVTLHSILTDQIDTYFYLQPRDWYQRLAAAYQQVSGKTLRKLPEALDLLSTWLRTLEAKMVKWDEEGLPYYTISREKLSQKILPLNMLAQRRKSEQEQAIQQAIDVALELGLLLKWEPAMGGTGYTFWLNPEQCSRLRAAALGAGGEPHA